MINTLYQDHVYSKLSEKYEERGSILTYGDLVEFAKERIAERISPKASSLEKAASLFRMSAESLVWLITDAHTLYNEVTMKLSGEKVSPFTSRSRQIFPLYWAYEVTKANLLSEMLPSDDKNRTVLGCKLGHDFQKYWPKTRGSTAFFGAGTSVAMAISEAMNIFLQKSYLGNFPEVPNYQVFRSFCKPYDRNAVMQELYKTDDIMPAVNIFQDISCVLISQYLPSERWTAADLDVEYSKVVSSINYEVEDALSAIGKSKEQKKQAPEATFRKSKKTDRAVPKNETSNPRIKFTFRSGQVFYCSKEIPIPAGETQNILMKLIKKIGFVVPYSEMRSDCVNSASDQLRSDISTIRQAFKLSQIPFSIENRRTYGYLLVPKK